LGLGVQTAYIHSDVDTLERVRIINELRAGVYDVLVGVNLLREGLDLPEVSLVAIFDADKDGFLRNQRSLTQTIGRAARNVNGKAIMYADTITPSMAATINETNRRREKQLQYNQDNNISPKQIRKTLANNNLIQNSSTDNIIPYIEPAPYEVMAVAEAETLSVEQKKKRIESLRSKMQEAAKRMEFTDAAILRDEMLRLQAEVDEEQK
ncbi:MAG: UvrB/UvrC motif-containing protein, partial [Bacteroidaceae bacterium]|nr:UvrB/UvrC motif-containing protein [Bacteroidaceae bacterium]